MHSFSSLAHICLVIGDLQRRLLGRRQAGDSTEGGACGRGPVGGFSVNLGLRRPGHLGAEPAGGGVAEGRGRRAAPLP